MKSGSRRNRNPGQPLRGEVVADASMKSGSRRNRNSQTRRTTTPDCSRGLNEERFPEEPQPERVDTHDRGRPASMKSGSRRNRNPCCAASSLCSLRPQ